MANPGERPSAKLPFRVRALLPLLLVVLGYASIQLYGRVPARPVVELSGASMGTTWSVKLAIDHELSPEIAPAINARLERVETLMSTWRDDSELTRFNQSTTTEPVSIAAESAAVLAVAQDIAARSGGAFDVSVGPLVQAWGFGSRGPREAPSVDRLAALRERVGYRKLDLQTESAAGHATLTKSVPGLEVDLSAVAKGFAVDEVARALAALGHDSFLVELGGELRAAGTHKDGGPWRVAIETPDVRGRKIHRIVELRDRSMATSGDYRNYLERDGVRFSHTIDPRSGRPITHALASVTVLHPEAVWADAWATALNVLGPEEGYALAREDDLAAYFIVRRIDGEGFETRMTPAFEPFLATQERRP